MRERTLCVSQTTYLKNMRKYYRNLPVWKSPNWFNFNLIQNDADDNKFVDCAICANAKLIVTEDRHFDILKQCDFPRIPVMGLDDFMDLLQ